MDIKGSEINAVILCGGMGTRLRSLFPNQQKALVVINNQVFLDRLIDYLIIYGFKKVILCIGYLREQVKVYYLNHPKKIQILFSEESVPLGTGGALKNAQHKITSKTILVLNGDSFCPINLNDFINFHQKKHALFTMVVSKINNRNDGGNVLVNSTGRIVDFREKLLYNHKCLINAGVYLMEQTVFNLIPENRKYSLEYDLFPKLTSLKSFAFITKQEVIDIGTPERFQKAKLIL